MIIKSHYEIFLKKKLDIGIFFKFLFVLIGGDSGDLEQLKEKIRREQQLVLQLEMDLQVSTCII